eukprot:UN24326
MAKGIKESYWLSKAHSWEEKPAIFRLKKTMASRWTFLHYFKALNWCIVLRLIFFVFLIIFFGKTKQGRS